LVSKEVASPEQIDDFKTDAEMLGALMPKEFPTYPITPKLDTLGMPC